MKKGKVPSCKPRLDSFFTKCSSNSLGKQNQSLVNKTPPNKNIRNQKQMFRALENHVPSCNINNASLDGCNTDHDNFVKLNYFKIMQKQRSSQLKGPHQQQQYRIPESTTNCQIELNNNNNNNKSFHSHISTQLGNQSIHCGYPSPGGPLSKHLSKTPSPIRMHNEVINFSKLNANKGIQGQFQQQLLQLNLNSNSHYKIQQQANQPLSKPLQPSEFFKYQQNNCQQPVPKSNQNASTLSNKMQKSGSMLFNQQHQHCNIEDKENMVSQSMQNVNFTQLIQQQQQQAGMTNFPDKQTAYNNNPKLVENIIDNILSKDDNTNENFKEENKNLLTNIKKLNLELQSTKNSNSQLEKENLDLKEKVLNERENFQQELQKITKQISHYKELEDLYNNEKQQHDNCISNINILEKNFSAYKNNLTKIVFDIFEILLISKSYDGQFQNYQSDADPIEKAKNFVDTIQSKIKLLIEKLNPFVIDLNLESQLKEFGNKVKEDIKQIFNPQSSKGDSSSSRHNIGQLISPQGMIIPLHVGQSSVKQSCSNRQKSDFDFKEYSSSQQNIQNNINVKKRQPSRYDKNSDANNLNQLNLPVQIDLQQSRVSRSNKNHISFDGNTNANNQQLNDLQFGGESYADISEKQVIQSNLNEEILAEFSQANFDGENVLTLDVFKQSEKLEDNGNNNNQSYNNKEDNKEDKCDNLEEQHSSSNTVIYHHSKNISQLSQSFLNPFNNNNHSKNSSQQFSRNNEDTFNMPMNLNNNINNQNNFYSSHNGNINNNQQYNQSNNNNFISSNICQSNGSSNNGLINNIRPINTFAPIVMKKELEIGKLSPCFNSSNFVQLATGPKTETNQIHKENFCHDDNYFSLKQEQSNNQIQGRTQNVNYNISNQNYDPMRRVKTEYDDVDEQDSFRQSKDGLFDSLCCQKTDNEYMLAKQDFVAQKSNDLNFKKGDRIQVKKKTKNGWWIGLCKGKIGYFNCHYAEPIKFA